MLNIYSRTVYDVQVWKNNNLFNDTKQCRIILRQRGGRLGNRLFMFATAYGLSLTHSCQLYIAPYIIDELQTSFEMNFTSIKKNPQSFVADDLATLTLCEHTILTAGTFGWWSAFLSHNRLGDVLTDSKSD
ncbi:unnamed protein product, partial [Adineta steineri]